MLSGGESDTTSNNFQKSELTTKELMPFTGHTFHPKGLPSYQAQRKSNLDIGELEERHTVSDSFLALLVFSSKIKFILKVINGLKKTNFTLAWISPTFPT